MTASSVSVIAHRGAASEAPENTVAAFDLAVALGADALELDVQRAGDGELVVIHDPTVDRTTAGAGRVEDLTGEELRSLGVPSLQEVFGLYPEMEITVDVKTRGATADTIGVVEALGRVERTILYVEDGTDDPEFKTYPGRRATSTAQAAELSRRSAAGDPLPAESPEVVHTPLAGENGRIVTDALIRAAHASGRTIQVWTVDEPDRMLELRDHGVDGIITNDVRLGVELLKGA